MPTMTIEEAYSLLEVHCSADEATVKSAYKKMALKTHPDKNPTDPDARHKFQRVSEAYKRITDPDSFKEEDDDMDYEMDMDELNEMFFSMFEDMIPMMMGGGFNPSVMGAGPMGLFEAMAGSMMNGDMFDDDSECDSDDEGDFIADGDLEDVMAMMMGGGMGGLSAMLGGMGGGRPEEIMFMEQMMGGMGSGMGMAGGRRKGTKAATAGWLEEEEPSASKKKKNRKKKKKAKETDNKAQDDETRWETDDSESESSPSKQPPIGLAPHGSSSTARAQYAEPFPPSSKKNKKKKKSKRNEDYDILGFDMSDDQDVEAMLMAMLMGGGSSAGMDGLFSGIPPKSRASASRASAAPTANSRQGRKPSSSKISSDGDADSTAGYYEEGDLVMVNNRDLARVRYVGPVEYAAGIFVGVELVDKSGVGKNNGTIKGVQYFSCPKNKGLMVRAEDIKPANGSF